MVGRVVGGAVVGLGEGTGVGSVVGSELFGVEVVGPLVGENVDDTAVVVGGVVVVDVVTMLDEL